MKAGIYHGLNHVRVEQLAMPEISPKDVLLRNLLGEISAKETNKVVVDLMK